MSTIEKLPPVETTCAVCHKPMRSIEEAPRVDRLPDGAVLITRPILVDWRDHLTCALKMGQA